jgi:hypothetical protein
VIIHEFPEAMAEKRKFLTEATEAKHRGHREASAILSVHSVVNELAHAGGHKAP